MLPLASLNLFRRLSFIGKQKSITNFVLEGMEGLYMALILSIFTKLSTSTMGGVGTFKTKCRTQFDSDILDKIFELLGIEIMKVKRKNLKSSNNH